MKQILFVTSNQHKVDEINKVLENYGCKTKSKNLDIIEADLPTIEDVAIDKAMKAFEKTKKPLIVEDTGLYFKAYQDFPGIYPKRIWLSLGYEGIFKLLKGKKRDAYFKVAIVYIWAKNKYKVFTGILDGKIGNKVKMRNAHRLPYEKIFIPNGMKKTVVELSREEKNKISHRSKAAHKFGKWLEKQK